MHLWQRNNWKAFYGGIECRTGLRLRYEKGIDPTLKSRIAEFCQWIRREFEFPIRVVIYVKNAEQIRARDGELVAGTFFEPFDRSVEPYIRVAVGDYSALSEKFGTFNAIACELECIAHELSHYYQWLNDIKLTPSGQERQAPYYAGGIVTEYIEENGICSEQ